jgi:hypothetical protein
MHRIRREGDRLSWMRFLGFELGAPTPDENTIRLFRNKLTETDTLKRVMKAFDWQLKKKGYIPPSQRLRAIACRATHVRPDRGCLPGSGTEAAEHRG